MLGCRNHHLESVCHVQNGCLACWGATNQQRPKVHTHKVRRVQFTPWYIQMDGTLESNGLPFRGVLENLPTDLLIGWTASRSIFMRVETILTFGITYIMSWWEPWSFLQTLLCKVHYHDAYSAPTRAQDLVSLPQALDCCI